jgi:hypothetical protein
MVVRNFHVERILALPAEAKAPLVIDADAVLPGAVAFQGIQVVAIGHAQIIQASGLMQQQQFPPRDTLNLRRQPPREFIIEQFLSFVTGEAANHLG